MLPWKRLNQLNMKMYPYYYSVVLVRITGVPSLLKSAGKLVTFKFINSGTWWFNRVIEFQCPYIRNAHGCHKTFLVTVFFVRIYLIFNEGIHLARIIALINWTKTTSYRRKSSANYYNLITTVIKNKTYKCKLNKLLYLWEVFRNY